jgi:hypothetical protein
MATRLALSLSLLVFAVAVASCGGGAATPAVPLSAVQQGSQTSALASAAPQATTSPLAVATSSVTNLAGVTDFQNVATALAASQRSDGAIAYTATNVNPYFANIAATGAARTGTDAAGVRAYLAWYVARSHDPNPWGIAGAITDYAIRADGTLQSTNGADSVDAYAATFLTLASTAWLDGDAATRTYIQSIHSDVERIASAIDAVTDTDGLTWALPTYRVKYVMDASEVYAGLNDLATLRANAYGDLAGSLAASQRAATLRATILATYWSDARGSFAVSVDASGTQVPPSPGVWQDAMTQLAPILHGVVAPSSAIAQSVYARFNAAFPAWTALSKPDEYPWTSVAYVALQMNDVARASAYRNAVDAAYPGAYPYPWYCAESGWYLRVIDGLVAPQTVAAD